MNSTQPVEKAAGVKEFVYRRRVVLGNLIAFFGFLVVWADPFASMTVPSLVLGGLIGTLGFALRIWASSYQWHNIANPLPSARTGLITAGPYAYVRHPIYLSMLLLTTGVFVAFGSWLAAALVVIVTLLLNLWQASYEDAYLREQYGPEAQRYQEHVMALIPKVWDPYPVRSGTFSLAQGLKHDVGPLSAFVCFILTMVVVTLYQRPTLARVLVVLIASVLFSFLLTWLVRLIFKGEFAR